MRRALSVALGSVAIAFAVLPGGAQARTATDPCPLHPGTGVFENGLLACDFKVAIPASEGRYLGPELTDANEDANYLPDSELQCPLNRRIPGTGTWGRAFAYNWGWDYYVEGNAWVLWDGRISDYWPGGGTILDVGAEGYNSFTAPFTNWGSGDPIVTRLFWFCNQVTRDSDRAASRPKMGGGSDDGLAGNGNDNALIGLGGDDRLFGHGGDDHLHGGVGQDALYGGVHDDLIHGRRHADTAVGGNGSDDILPGKGGDVARGGSDDDQLFDDEGRDTLHGGCGNDRFSARDGDRDVIDCGPGDDIAIIDRADVARRCEYVFRTARETPRTLPRI